MEPMDTRRVEELLTRCHSVLPPSLKELPSILKRYPLLTIFAVIFVIISALPLLFFIVFALSSFIFLLIGFLLVEGTILAFGTCVLASALLFATVAALGISGTVWVVGFVFSNWRQLAKECTEYIDTQLAKYLTVDSSEKKTT
jgi:glucan phosphoethanolaminetransferase (alkaline phosphatase superfamily)